MPRALLLLLGVLLLAGCGASERPGAALGEAAEIAPASARVFVVLRTDAEADQTRAALDLLERFPAIRDYELQLEDDILPALGDEAALVVLRGGAAIVLARPDDREKLDALLTRTEPRAATRELEGWTAIADDQEDLDAFEREREAGTLSDDDAFRAEFDALPEDALAKAWSEKQDIFPAITAAVFADEDGLRFEGSARGGPETQVAPFEAQLLDRVPAGASLVASFRGQGGLAAQLRSLPVPPGLGLEELGELLEGEGVFYVRRAALIPEATLLTEVEDEKAAEAAVSRLLGRLGAPVSPSEQGGGGRLTLGPVTISYGARDGVFALTTASLDAVLEPAADDLADDPRFAEAAERAKLPDESGGFLYVRIDDLVPLLTMLSGAQGLDLPSEVRENLEPLRTLLVHAGRDGDRTTFSGLLELAP